MAPSAGERTRRAQLRHCIPRRLELSSSFRILLSEERVLSIQTRSFLEIIFASSSQIANLRRQVISLLDQSFDFSTVLIFDEFQSSAERFGDFGMTRHRRAVDLCFSTDSAPRQHVARIE